MIRSSLDGVGAFVRRFRGDGRIDAPMPTVVLPFAWLWSALIAFVDAVPHAAWSERSRF